MGWMGRLVCALLGPLTCYARFSDGGREVVVQEIACLRMNGLSACSCDKMESVTVLYDDAASISERFTYTGLRLVLLSATVYGSTTSLSSAKFTEERRKHSTDKQVYFPHLFGSSCLP